MPDDFSFGQGVCLIDYFPIVFVTRLLKVTPNELPMRFQIKVSGGLEATPELELATMPP